MKKDWIRAWQHQGVRLLILPMVVLAALAYAYWEYTGAYFDHWDETTTLGTKLDVVDAELDLRDNIKNRHDALKPEFTLAQTSAFRTASRDEALGQMKSMLTQMLGSLYFEVIQVEPAKSPSQANILAMDAEFSGVPQQLPRFELALQSQAKPMRVENVQIKTIAAPKGGEPHIEIKARIVALHLPPEGVPAAAVPAVAPASSPRAPTMPAPASSKS